VRGFGLFFDVLMPASVDLWVLLLSVAAVIALVRFKAGMIPTLRACSAAGVALYLLTVIAGLEAFRECSGRHELVLEKLPVPTANYRSRTRLSAITAIPATMP
jgi:hypothetical protein